DLDLAAAAGAGELADRDTSFRLRADIDQRHVLFDTDDLAFDDGAFLQIALAECLIEHRGKIFARGRGSSSGSHSNSNLFAHDLVRKPVPTFRDHAAHAGSWIAYASIARKPQARNGPRQPPKAGRHDPERSKRW